MTLWIQQKKLIDMLNIIGYDVNVLGIPKIIDSDLMYTDYCLVYGSVAKFIATNTLELALDAEAYSISTINVLEVMRRKLVG